MIAHVWLLFSENKGTKFSWELWIASEGATLENPPSMATVVRSLKDLRGAGVSLWGVVCDGRGQCWLFMISDRGVSGGAEGPHLYLGHQMHVLNGFLKDEVIRKIVALFDIRTLDANSVA